MPNKETFFCPVLPAYIFNGNAPVTPNTNCCCSYTSITKLHIANFRRCVRNRHVLHFQGSIKGIRSTKGPNFIVLSPSKTFYLNFCEVSLRQETVIKEAIGQWCLLLLKRTIGMYQRSHQVGVMRLSTLHAYDNGLHKQSRLSKPFLNQHCFVFLTPKNQIKIFDHIDMLYPLSIIMRIFLCVWYFASGDRPLVDCQQLSNGC